MISLEGLPQGRHRERGREHGHEVDEYPGAARTDQVDADDEAALSEQ